MSDRSKTISPVKKMVLIAMFSAIAYASVFVARTAPPLVPFPPLRYDPKDIIIVFGGFILGPVPALIISAIVSFFEMITFSTTGYIGFIMNVVSSASFCCTAVIIYKFRKSLSGAVIGLISGCLLTTGLMLLWNYFLTPIYMGYPRQAVADMLVPVFLPFNLLKGSLNAAGAMLLYKPLVMGLRKARLIPPSTTDKGQKINFAVIVVAALAAAVVAGLMVVFKAY